MALSREGISRLVFVFLPQASASLSVHRSFIYNELSSLSVPVAAQIPLLLACCFCHFQHVCTSACPSPSRRPDLFICLLVHLLSSLSLPQRNIDKVPISWLVWPLFSCTIKVKLCIFFLLPNKKSVKLLGPKNECIMSDWWCFTFFFMIFMWRCFCHPNVSANHYLPFTSSLFLFAVFFMALFSSSTMWRLLEQVRPCFIYYFFVVQFFDPTCLVCLCKSVHLSQLRCPGKPMPLSFSTLKQQLLSLRDKHTHTSFQSKVTHTHKLSLCWFTKLVDI